MMVIIMHPPSLLYNRQHLSGDDYLDDKMDRTVLCYIVYTVRWTHTREQFLQVNSSLLVWVCVFVCVFWVFCLNWGLFLCHRVSFITCVSYAEARNSYRLDVRPSVRLSVTRWHPIKTLNILSCFLHHTIAHSF